MSPNTPDNPNAPMNDDNTPMNPATDARITEAFRDLSRRAGTVPVDNGPHVNATAGGNRRRFANLLGGSSGRGEGRGGDRGADSRLIPALAFAALAAVAGFGAWQLLPGGDSDKVNVAADGDLDNDGSTGDSDNDDDNDGSDDATGTDDGTSDGTSTDDDPTDTANDTDDDASPAPGQAGSRYRVSTAKVAADTSDPFLNVRRAPDAGAELTAKLPPTYRGLRHAGETSTADNGASWILVELLDPVDVNLGEPLHGGQPAGWVNAAFLTPLEEGIAVGTDEIPACDFGAAQSTASGTMSAPGYVYGLESGFVGPGADCLRVVVTFAAGSNPFLWEEVPAGTGPAAALPGAVVSSSGGSGVVIELGDNIVSAWSNATETDDGVYIARSADGSVDLVSPVPVSRVGVTPLADSGILVIDMEVAGEAPQSGRFVALTDEPTVGPGTVTVTGLARPFEANLGVSIIDDDGQPVAVLYSGSAALGTQRGTEYGVQTNDWTEAWGRFAVTAADLQPGSYMMLLDGEGGNDTPTRTAVPFTIAEGPSSDAGEPDTDDQAAAQALIRFAQGDSPAELNLADEVTLGLGIDHEETFTRAELANRENWVFDVDSGFGGFTGPFDLLEPLANGQVRFSTGPIPHCAGPPRDWPTEWDALSQINIEPVGIDSCIAWYGVSLFRNNGGEIEVIVLDLFGP